MTKESTHWEDLGAKRPLYEWLGVRGEYFPCDPMAEYLRPVLRGFRLSGDRYADLKDRPPRSEVPAWSYG